MEVKSTPPPPLAPGRPVPEVDERAVAIAARARLEWALVEEQYGRTTNALHWHVPNAYNVWAHASAEQVERYLRPALRGELKDAYAVSERDAGSDPSAIVATAEAAASGFRL